MEPLENMFVSAVWFMAGTVVGIFVERMHLNLKKKKEERKNAGTGSQPSGTI